jgi:hypothetical protein
MPLSTRDPHPTEARTVEGGQLSETWGFGDDGTRLCRADDGPPDPTLSTVDGAISCRMEDQATLAQGVGGCRSCREKKVRRYALAAIPGVLGVSVVC